MSILITQADGTKCERCWNVLPEVGERIENLCPKCTDIILEHYSEFLKKD